MQSKNYLVSFWTWRKLEDTINTKVVTSRRYIPIKYVRIFIAEIHLSHHKAIYCLVCLLHWKKFVRAGSIPSIHTCSTIRVHAWKSNTSSPSQKIPLLCSLLFSQNPTSGSYPASADSHLINLKSMFIPRSINIEVLTNQPTNQVKCAKSFLTR